MLFCLLRPRRNRWPCFPAAWIALSPATVSILNSIVYDPCFALMVTLAGPSAVPPPGYVRLDSGPIAFIADNTQKGVSTGPAALTIHARSDFTRIYLDSPHDEVAQLLIQSAKPWLGSEPIAWQLHRWKYSQPVATTAEPYLFALEPAPLAFAGDGFGGPRIEGAFLSGLAAARRIASSC
ncbi:MAG: FAD-dependent oxidoreductase [Acidobacteriota bacterium]|nr:FAD-dependent oxidoreductase [Acidobacteriota bacterium]